MDSRSSEPVSVDELLYRRFATQWWSSAKTNPKQLPVSFFKPRAWKSEDNPGDIDGVSVSRAGISSIEVASTSPRSGKRMCLAQFPARAALDRGLDIVPDSTEQDPGHALIPQLNSLAQRDRAGAAVITEHATALRDAAEICWTPDSG